MRDLIGYVSDIAREAGALLLEKEGARDLIIEEKGSTYDFVTEADTASQALIKRRVAELFPGDRVIGEEDGLPDEQIIRTVREARGSSRLWLVDPLDGTLNYIKGIGGYTVSIAVFRDGEAVAGAVYVPGRDEMFLAERGGGSFCNGRRLRVAEHGRLQDSLALTGNPVSDFRWRVHACLWNRAVTMQALNMRMVGSSARSQCLVAAGRADYYYELGPHPWDMAAGTLMVSEAGGAVSRLDGKPYDLGLGGIVVSSAAIHDEVIRIIADSDPQLSQCLPYPAGPEKR